MLTLRALLALLALRALLALLTLRALLALLTLRALLALLALRALLALLTLRALLALLTLRALLAFRLDLCLDSIDHPISVFADLNGRRLTILPVCAIRAVGPVFTAQGFQPLFFRALKPVFHRDLISGQTIAARREGNHEHRRQPDRSQCCQKLLHAFPPPY